MSLEDDLQDDYYDGRDMEDDGRAEWYLERFGFYPQWHEVLDEEPEPPTTEDP